MNMKKNYNLSQGDDSFRFFSIDNYLKNSDIFKEIMANLKTTP